MKSNSKQNKVYKKVFFIQENSGSYSNYVTKYDKIENA